MSAVEHNRPCVYCAVVATRGSTPQKPGAAMLVFADGTQVGTLGGGCVEAEVKQNALHALDSDGPAEVSTFFLDDIQGWDDGLICGGRMTMLVHPFGARNAHLTDAAYYRTLLEHLKRGDAFTEAVVIDAVAGLPLADRYLFRDTGDRIACLADQPAWDHAAAHLPDFTQRPRPSTHDGIAYLPTLPRITLLIVGGGHVGEAVGQLAADAGFAIWVVDDRDRFASRDRFPTAERLLVGDIGPTLRDLVPELTQHTYALIVTRGHKHDEEALYHLAASPCAYVGMIGSRRKVRLILDDLRSQDVADAALARVRAPVGLDIGSQTVPEVAISIVAELIARRNLGALPPRDVLP